MDSCKWLYLKSTQLGIKTTERQHTFHIGIASGSTRYCWKWRLVKFISCPKTMIELYQIYFSIATLGPAKTSYARPHAQKKKKINLCHLYHNLYCRFFNNGSFQITQSDRIQVNLNKTDALFHQICQNMMADCLSDFPSFYTNLHKLFCQFISWTICVNSDKYIDNFWTIICHFMA